MPKIFQIKPLFTEQIPDIIEEGILYISEKYEVCVHLCACGCREKAVLPLDAGEWILKKNGDQVSTHPSIGNWSGQKPYHAHYYITNNKIIWCND